MSPLRAFLSLLALHPACSFWSLTRLPDLCGGIPYWQAANGDKDGSIVAARLAGATSGVSDTRLLATTVTRRADGTYAGDVASLVAALYASAAGPLLNASTLVVGSVHRAALYAAEALHAPVLPAQTLAFADTLEQACAASNSGESLVLTGSDYGFDGLWLWLKPASAAGIPPAHLAALSAAAQLLLLRATDGDEYLGSVPCGASGGGFLAIHSSLRDLAAAPGRPATAALWQRVQPLLQPLNGTPLRQWEWGLPDATVAAYRAAWAALGRPAAAVTVLQGEVVDGFLAVPLLWARYLANNGVQQARGVSVNGYWVALPALERLDGVLPFPAYAFYKPQWHPLYDAALAALRGAAAAIGAPTAANHTRLFINGVGADTEREGATLLLKEGLGVAGSAAACQWGLDCPPAAVASCAGGVGVAAHEAAARVLAEKGGLVPERQWEALTVAQVAEAMGGRWA